MKIQLFYMGLLVAGIAVFGEVCWAPMLCKDRTMPSWVKLNVGATGNTVDYKCAERVQALEGTVSTMKNQIQELTEVITGKMTTDATTISSTGCVSYRNKCFKTPQDLLTTESVDLNQARTMCTDIGWKLANIYSTEHYEAIAEYLRNKYPKINQPTVWLGMTLGQDSQLYLSNGTVGPTLKWYPGFPGGSGGKMISMDVLHVKNHNYQGMVNQPPENKRKGALCEN
uniref:uncharacterized protein LOC120326847 isoform X2 n=1 Tax=Styela clava TaxID=7725 RepID=UPI00193A2055|nr:uncharacterized protein LOC120326847 isoform X2 [Styela clava]